MTFEYRWAHVLCLNGCLLLAVFLVDFLPLSDEYQNMENKLTELQNIQSEPVAVASTKHPNHLQKSLLQLLSDSHIQIINMQQNNNVFDLQLRANTTNTMSLLASLYVNEHAVRIQNFNLQSIGRHNVQLNTRLTVHALNSYRQLDQQLFSGFCATNLQHISPKKAQFLSKKAHMIGVFQSASEHAVVLMWPNGLAEQYDLGDEVGNDAARIILINNNTCLLLANGQLFEIPYTKR